MDEIEQGEVRKLKDLDNQPFVGGLKLREESRRKDSKVKIIQGTYAPVVTEKPAQVKVPEHVHSRRDASNLSNALQQYSKFMLQVVEECEQNNSVAETARKLEDLNKQDFMKD